MSSRPPLSARPSLDRAILHFGAPQTGRIGCLEGANCKIAGPVAAASLSSSAPPCPVASIMNWAVLGVRFVTANLMINPVWGPGEGLLDLGVVVPRMPGLTPFVRCHNSKIAVIKELVGSWVPEGAANSLINRAWSEAAGPGSVRFGVCGRGVGFGGGGRHSGGGIAGGCGAL